MILGCLRPKGLNIFFWSTKSFASKNQTAPDFFFLWSQFWTNNYHLHHHHPKRSFVRSEAGSALKLQQNCRQTDARTDLLNLYIYIYICVCVCVCVHLFLVDQFLPLTSFSLFVQQSLLWIYTFTTSNATTLYITTAVMPVCMASYMTAGYRHANHAFMVNVRS